MPYPVFVSMFVSMLPSWPLEREEIVVMISTLMIDSERGVLVWACDQGEIDTEGEDLRLKIDNTRD